ncbi:SMP-30/gluconolactonase/LRE family protein [Spirosoma pomorum]
MHAYYFISLFLSSVLMTNPSPQPVSVAYTSEADSANLIAPGATLQRVSDQFSFTEGPAVDKDGNVYFTDQPNNKIWHYSTDGKLSLFMDNAGRSNGMYFDKAGNLISCADANNELWSISPDKKVTVLMSGYQGKRLNGPNDVWVDAKGNCYFTDPFYKRDYWTHSGPEVDGQNLFFLPKGKKDPILFDGNYKRPNGIIGTPDGKTLYVADIGDSKTYKYQINGDGSLSNRQLFTNQGSDGMTLDEKGNVYLTGKGVMVYNPAGELILTIPVPEGWTGNICFAGKDRKTLFITASKSVYTLNMQVAGAQ